MAAGGAASLAELCSRFLDRSLLKALAVNTWAARIS